MASEKRDEFHAGIRIRNRNDGRLTNQRMLVERPFNLSDLDPLGTVSNAVNNRQLGAQTVTYTATDPQGLRDSKTRTVTVSDTRAPVVTPIGSMNVTRPVEVVLATVAVRVSGAPKVTGFAELASVIVVACCRLVNEIVAFSPLTAAVTL